MPDDPDVELELAYGALADANTLRQQGTKRGAISRLYYACFHAAQAVLYEKGFYPKQHGAVSRLFGREVVLAGDASRSDGEFLNEMYDTRREADYEQSPPTVNVDSLYSRSEIFVDNMSDLIEDTDETDNA